jgi:hypothetical protein
METQIQSAPALTLKEPMAKKLDYTENPGSVKDRPEKMGVAGKEQSCQNCQLFVAASEDPKVKLGSCLLFPNYSVKAGAWCRSWIKRHLEH